MDKYVFVNSLDPSGVKDSIVVGQSEAENQPYPRVSDRYDLH
jgi:hypothetical protein